MAAKIPIDRERIAEFCRRWKIEELALFGSVLRDDFTSASDVDVLVTFAPGEEWTLLDVVEMQQCLSGIMGREVDLVLRESLVNPFRRREILRTRKVIDVA
ncbi:MAG: nucleotidyltransferase family protein [Planctomycetota bacterium]|jgi:predicted nucleotidyltransferase